MSSRQPRLSKLNAASTPIQTDRLAWPTDVNQQGIRQRNQFNQRYLSRERGMDLAGMLPRLYRLSAPRYRNTSPPRPKAPRVAQWFQRLYSTLPRRPSIDWQQFEQELYAPAVRSVQMEMQKALPELENRDIYSGIEGSSSWSQRAKARAFSNAARIMGDLRSQAGARRKELQMRQAAQESSEALGLLRLASDLASREAGAKNEAGMSSWRIGEQARIQDVLRKGADASDFLRTLLRDAVRSRNSRAVARLSNLARRVLR